MSKFDILKDLVSSKAARPLLHLQKHSPVILLAAGTVGVVGTVVLACRATLKVSDVLERYEDDKNKALILAEKPGHPYHDEDALKNELHKRQLKTAIEIAKPYLPALGLGIVSIAALTGSHVILSKRNGAIMAAYAALDRGYREYRQRVATEFGTEVDQMFHLGGERTAVEEKMADGSIKVTDKIALEGRFGGSPFAFIFDEQSHKFSKQPGANAATVDMIQNFANQKLRSQGHLFLNELMDMLGMPHTQAGSVVGWIYDGHNERNDGVPRDNYVDFGIFGSGMDHDDVNAFIDGNHYYITIDPNVDGVIWDKI